MEIIKAGRILVEEKSIPVAFNLDTPKIYKKAFKRDFYSDLEIEYSRSEDACNISETNRRAWQVVWSFAKTADSSIQRIDRWAKQFNNVSGLFMIDKIDEFLKV